MQSCELAISSSICLDAGYRCEPLTNVVKSLNDIRIFFNFKICMHLNHLTENTDIYIVKKYMIKQKFI